MVVSLQSVQLSPLSILEHFYHPIPISSHPISHPLAATPNPLYVSRDLPVLGIPYEGSRQCVFCFQPLSLSIMGAAGHVSS